MTTIAKKTRREEILEAASELFREKGYAASTMRDIADKVGIEAASLYNHIKSKDELLQEICFETGHRFVQQMRETASNSKNSTSQVKELIHSYIAITTQYPAMVSVANDEWRHLNEPQLSEFVEMRTNYENCFLEIIKIGVEKGEFRDNDCTVILYTILSSMRWLQYWYREDRGIDVADIKNEISDLILKGLMK